MENQWGDTGLMIDNYLVEVKVKKERGVYYVTMDNKSYSLTAAGATLPESLQSFKIMYLGKIEVIYTRLLNELRIEKPI